MAVPLRFSSEMLRQARLRRGWTQAKLARRADVSERQIVRWEAGPPSGNVPSADAVAALANALEIDVGDFYERAAEDEEEDDSDMARVAADLERLGHADMAADLRARTRKVPRRAKELA